MKVALYARVSSESQQARGSIGSQLEVLRARIAGQGDELVAEFCDDGYSGARLDRPGLDALRDRAEAGGFEAVWCLSPDRLARAYVYQVVVLDELAALGVPVLFHDAPAIDDDPQARLLTQMQGVIAEYERAKICERNRRGRLWRSRAGEVVSWKVPYGYRRVPRDAKSPAHLEVFEPEAVVVRRIFDEYVAGGRSIRQIVRGLNTDQIPTPTGKTAWWHSTLCRVLRNEAYIGRVYFNQTEQIPAPSRAGRRPTVQRRRPREEWIAIPCPAIIDDAVFEAASKVSRDNSQWSPRNLPEDIDAWLLRGLVRCGACDGKLNCQKMTTRYGKVYRYYWCRNHASTGAPDQQRCTERNVRANTLDDFVFNQIRVALTRPDVLRAGQSAVTATAATPDDELLTAELSRLNRKLEANQAERRRLADLYQTGLLELTDIQRRAHDIDARHRSLTEQRDALIEQRQQLASDNRLSERLTDFAGQAAAGIDTLTFHQRQQLLRLVIDHVTVTGWQVEIQLRIPLDEHPDGGHNGDDRPSGGPNDHPRHGPVTPPPPPPAAGSNPDAGTMSNKDGLRSVRRVDVPQVGGQQRHPPVDVLTGPIPGQQRVHGKGMPEVIWARPGTGAASFQSDLADQLDERRVEFRAAHPPSPRRQEERRRGRCREASLTQAGIGAKRTDRARVQRHLPLFVVLSGAHVHHAVVQVDIFAVESERLGGATASDGQQPDQRLVTGCAQRRPQLSSGCHQRRDLLLGVDVGGDAGTVPGQQVAGRDLAGGIDRGQVPGETTHHREPLAPRKRMGVDGEPCPRQRQLGGDPRRLGPVEELDEPFEHAPVLGHREAEPAADAQVVIQRRTQRAHDTPADVGHGRASGRSAPWSTLA